MKRHTTLLAAALLSTTAACCQQVIATFDAENGASTIELGETPSAVLGTATLLVSYESRSRLQPESLPERITEDFMLLEAGGGRTKFYSEKQRQTDSLIAASSPEQILANPGAFSSKGASTAQLYGDAEAGTMTHLEKIMSTWYRYTEPLAAIDWTIGDEEREVAGYRCTKATGRFRGRDWSVWFAAELAVDAGPWKLRGLPGLILAAATEDGQFSFEAVGIRTCEQPITQPERAYLDTTREKFLKVQYRAHHDPLGFMTATSNIRMTVKNEEGKEVDPASLKREYNQIEKE